MRMQYADNRRTMISALNGAKEGGCIGIGAYSNCNGAEWTCFLARLAVPCGILWLEKDGGGRPS